MKINSRIILFLFLFVALPAWAGQGWYLLKPFFKSNVPPGLNIPDLSVPLSQWDQEAVFDSVKECKNDRKRLTQLYSTKLKLAEKKNDADSKLFFNIQFSQILSARCIASDDPRLK